MADHKKKAANPQKAAAAAKPVLTALSAHAALYDAVESFVRVNCHVESSILINAALADLGLCRDLNELFSTPIRRQLFSMSVAQNWVLFLRNAPARAAQEDGGAPFSDASPFDTVEAMTLLESVYDIGVQEAVWDHFEEDDEDEDGDEDEGEDAGEDDGAE